MGAQGAGAFRIGLYGVRMLAAVDLDDQPVRRYGKIRDVASDRMLSPYLDGEALTQRSPQYSLRFRRVPA